MCRYFVALATVCLVANSIPADEKRFNAQEAIRPNVLIVMVDDLGYSDLSCYGGELSTPSIDQLAKNGLRYSAFYTSARCCPSRAALLTGLYPHLTGLGSFATPRPDISRGPAYLGFLNDSCSTLAEMLKGRGYSTWMVGKWHLGASGPIDRGFSNYFGFQNFLSYGEDQWNPKKYVRLPPVEKPEIDYHDTTFYATDVFTDYALEFLEKARKDRNKPWFLYLAHSSPHFPLQAPKADIDRFVPIYRKGWDSLRASRFERMKKLGLIPKEAVLPPRETVPVDEDAIANNFSGQPNPAWESLPEDRREDLARRMATYAAMVKHVDAGIGRIVASLEKNLELSNTLILFMSDNGACYEWGPFGFDVESRRGTTTLHQGALLDKMGQAETNTSYGSGWANLGNTPLRLYKHFCHEGGLRSPLVVHWPNGIKNQGRFVHDPAHLMDIVPTVLQMTGIEYPTTRNEKPLIPLTGTSLLPTFVGEKLPERLLAFEHQSARGLRKGDWKIAWGKRMNADPKWELYNLAVDPMERNDLAVEQPKILAELSAAWLAWAKQVKVDPFWQE